MPAPPGAPAAGRGTDRRRGSPRAAPRWPQPGPAGAGRRTTSPMPNRPAATPPRRSPGWTRKPSGSRPRTQPIRPAWQRRTRQPPRRRTRRAPPRPPPTAPSSMPRTWRPAIARCPRRSQPPRACPPARRAAVRPRRRAQQVGRWRSPRPRCTGRGGAASGRGRAGAGARPLWSCRAGPRRRPAAGRRRPRPGRRAGPAGAGRRRGSRRQVAPRGRGDRRRAAPRRPGAGERPAHRRACRGEPAAQHRRNRARQRPRALHRRPRRAHPAHRRSRGVGPGAGGQGRRALAAYGRQWRCRPDWKPPSAPRSARNSSRRPTPPPPGTGANCRRSIRRRPARRRDTAPTWCGPRRAGAGALADRPGGGRAGAQAGLLPGQALVSRSGAVWRWDGYVDPGRHAHPGRHPPATTQPPVGIAP